MAKLFKYSLLVGLSLALINVSHAQERNKNLDIIEKSFLHPPASAKPWVFWYWLHGAVSKEGITADLEAMKEVGIGGAYLMPIKDTSSAIPFQPIVRQLSPEWWAMVKFAMQEAKRLGLQLGMHLSDGFALAGGPWITPELSMQKLVWTKTYIKAGHKGAITLDQPETIRGYYKDVAVFAYPANSSYAFSNDTMIPSVTTSNGANAEFLSLPDNKQNFRSDSNCWIQYQFPKPFTCRSIRIHAGSNSYQAQRLIVQTSEDGVNFKTITRLNPPRHGWQDTEEDYTHAIPATTSGYFRFVYNKEGSEPGSEDLDAGKWRPSLRVMGIYLSDEPVINQYEAKNGSIWRVATSTTVQQVSDKDAVPLKNVINLTGKLGGDGKLNWTPPGGHWVIVRIGHTSTGQTNTTGGAGRGLECDKFNATAVKLEFDSWFGKAFEKTDPALAKSVLKIFHVDSWECGSQNWSSNFASEFKKRRGYDLLPYLLVMTGVPVQSAASSEKWLRDVRTTIAELVNDVFYVTLKKLSAAKGCSFSAESIAPTFVSDGLLHYKNVDIPMGEFWLNSPTHDKPNDMLDAISGAHIYGKNIVQAEAFTTLRSDWGEHPGNIKALGDRAFAAGINKFSLHVFMHNPWLDRKPGMTLDGIGLFYQRDQVWFKQSKAWIEYLTRCQALLQLGKPIVDIGVFTGEEVPRRSILPDRLATTLPGIFGNEKLDAEANRLQNSGQPLRQLPDGVTHSANMADPGDWINPLNGYTYDCFNPDVLIQMKVVNRRVVTPGGASYAVLVIPGRHPMNPNAVMSDAVKNKLKQLAASGAKIILGEDYIKSVESNGNFIKAPFTEGSFESIGLKKEIMIDSFPRMNWEERTLPMKVAFCERRVEGKRIYFISNQNNQAQTFVFWFENSGFLPEIYNPVTGRISEPFSTDVENGKVTFFESFAAFESKFIIFSKKGTPVPFKPEYGKPYGGTKRLQPLLNGWDIIFKNEKQEINRKLRLDTAALSRKYDERMLQAYDLKSWTEDTSDFIKYFSGTAVYHTTYTFDKNPDTVNTIELQMQTVLNIASVKVNGIDCGTVWTGPYHVDIKKAIKPGENKIEIEVTNTWRNRLIGDELIPEKRTTWLNSPYKLKGKSLLPAGLIGRVEIFTQWGK